jgi:hypothetical protein
MRPEAAVGVRRDAAVATLAVCVVVAVAAVFEGNMALVALPLVGVVAAAIVRASVARRIAVAAAVVILGGYLGLLAHWTLYDHSPLTAHWSWNGAFARRVAALVLAAGAISLANRRRPPATRTGSRSGDV